MKTTVDIHDQLFLRAQRKARREGRTMRSLIEEGLRLTLEAESIAEPYRLRDFAVGEPGGPDPLASMSWAELRDEIYGRR